MVDLELELVAVPVVMPDADAARTTSTERGSDVGEVQDFPRGRFVPFADPDGNTWAVQAALR